MALVLVSTVGAVLRLPAIPLLLAVPRPLVMVEVTELARVAVGAAALGVETASAALPRQVRVGANGGHSDASDAGTRTDSSQASADAARCLPRKAGRSFCGQANGLVGVQGLVTNTAKTVTRNQALGHVRRVHCSDLGLTQRVWHNLARPKGICHLRAPDAV